MLVESEIAPFPGFIQVTWSILKTRLFIIITKDAQCKKHYFVSTKEHNMSNVMNTGMGLSGLPPTVIRKIGKEVLPEYRNRFFDPVPMAQRRVDGGWIGDFTDKKEIAERKELLEQISAKLNMETETLIQFKTELTQIESKIMEQNEFVEILKNQYSNMLTIFFMRYPEIFQLQR